MESVRLLATLSGGTRLENYERILGSRFALTKDERSGILPLQIYELAGSTDAFGVSMVIQAMGADPRTPKSVSLRLGRIAQRPCIHESDLNSFALAHFEVTASKFLPGTPVGGLVFTPPEKHDDPDVWVSYQQTPEGRCVEAIGIFYLPKANEWGH